MKDYRRFLLVFGVLLIFYIIAEVNKPAAVNWTVTLSKDDKNPYGSYILYQRLKDLFPHASVKSFRLPVYNQLNTYRGAHSAYVIISPAFSPTNDDWAEMKSYVAAGNYLLASASNFGKLVLDSLGVKTFSRVSVSKKDSTAVNFVNPRLRRSENYNFKRFSIDEYFSKTDTTRTAILGVNNYADPNYLKIAYGDGAFFIHAAPLCFSNYFMLFQNNAEYVAKAFSYLPADVHTVFWDEYYKLGPSGASTPLRFFLSNAYLLWALRLALAGLIIYVLFEMKRRQRVIPLITPLQNSTLDFVKTVSNVYFNQKDNNSIAHKKSSYFLEFVRQHFHLQTQHLDEDFIEQLSRKSGVDIEKTRRLVQLLSEIELGYPVSDNLLILLDQQIDNFYKQAR